MYRIFCFLFCGLAILLIIHACESPESKEERLARQYCGSCHLFPEPGLLDKKTWGKSVLPEMAFRMGLDKERFFLAATSDDLGDAMSVIPSTPMISPQEFELIRRYYVRAAPDSLVRPAAPAPMEMHQFDVSAIRINSQLPLLCMIKADTLHHQIFLGDRRAKLYQLNEQFVVQDSFQLASPPSAMQIADNEPTVLSLMGIMDPNDQAKGKLVQFDHGVSKLLIDSIKRPVFFQKADLNNDGREDYVICAFGNLAGALLAYENLGDNKFRKHVIYAAPGSRKVVLRDIDHDGKQDIITLFTQGNELLTLFRNKGNFEFDEETLLRFPSVYGSSYFEVIDFNHDGHFDILYTNGDNSDYSQILKPYHGVRIFLNDGHQKFSESWFGQMYGASIATARDFDGDGDLDVAAISFFPDFIHHAEQGFIYFENQHGKMVPHTTPLARSGRWLVMEAADIDHDGDCDLILGALFFRVNPVSLQNEWSGSKKSLLVLKNNKIRK